MAKGIDTIIVSDIQMGSGVSRSDALLEMLQEFSFKRLILNGDIFDDLDFDRLKEKDWKLLSYLRELSDAERGVEVVWVVGNHDELLSEVTSHLVGVSIYKKYEWEYQGEKYLAIHGHQFDSFMIENRLVSAIASTFYNVIQKLEGKKHRLSRMLKRISKSWLRLTKKVAREAMEYGSKSGVQYIFCGHTHKAFSQEAEGIKYFNSGCWADSPANFIVINEEGVAIKEWK